jgi:hypothetical protein
MPESISKSRAERETRDGKECLYAAYVIERTVGLEQAQHILSTHFVKANGVRPRPLRETDDAKRRYQIAAMRSFASARLWPILLKNSVREVERATLRKPTSQIDSGSTIVTSARVE